MKFFLLTVLFTLPFVASAASFELASGEIEVGESTQVTLSIVPEEESVYTAKAVLAFDEKTLSISDVAISDTWMALSQSGYDSQENGQIVKTAGYPGGITEKTALLTFTVAKIAEGPGVIAIEGTSFIYNANSENVAKTLDTLVFGALTENAPSLPAAFSLTQTVEAPEIVAEISAPLEEISKQLTLPAAVVTISGEIPVVPITIALLVLLGGLAIYFMIRAGRRRA